MANTRIMCAVMLDTKVWPSMITAVHVETVLMAVAGRLQPDVPERRAAPYIRRSVSPTHLCCDPFGRAQRSGQASSRIRTRR